MWPLTCGGAEGTRTPDPLHAIATNVANRTSQHYTRPAKTTGKERCAVRSGEASRCMVAGKSTGSVTRKCRRSAPIQLAPSTLLVEAEAELARTSRICWEAARSGGSCGRGRGPRGRQTRKPIADDRVKAQFGPIIDRLALEPLQQDFRHRRRDRRAAGPRPHGGRRAGPGGVRLQVHRGQGRRGRGQALAVRADVADAEQVEAAVGGVAGELGPPTVLVNNVGVIRDNLLHKMTDDDWDTVPDPGPPGGPPRRHRQHHRLPGKRGRVVRVRAGDLRRRRSACLTRSG
jgi:short chain dehydrogenase